MIVASTILLFIGFITLVIGLFQDGPEMIVVSIASSILAGATLFLGVLQGRKREAELATGGGPVIEAASAGGTETISLPGADEALAADEAPTLAAEQDLALQTAETAEERAPGEDLEPAAATPRRAGTSRRGAAKSPARKTAAKTAARKSAAKPAPKRAGKAAPAKAGAKAAPKTAARTPAPKTAARKPAAAKPAAKPAAKKSPAKPVAAKKSPTKKSPAKPAARRGGRGGAPPAGG